MSSESTSTILLTLPYRDGTPPTLLYIPTLTYHHRNCAFAGLQMLVVKFDYRFKFKQPHSIANSHDLRRSPKLAHATVLPATFKYSHTSHKHKTHASYCVLSACVYPQTLPHFFIIGPTTFPLFHNLFMCWSCSSLLASHSSYTFTSHSHRAFIPHFSSFYEIQSPIGIVRH